MTNYRLVNPIIGGKFNSSFSGKSNLDAAEGAWNSISTHIKKNIPQFAFTLERENDGKMQHFLVKEKVSESGYSSDSENVNYSLSEINSRLNDTQLQTFKNHIHSCQSKLSQSQQTGGDKKERHDKKYTRRERFDDSSSSSSSSSSDSDSLSDVYRTLKVKNAAKNLLQLQPYYWYTPVIYDLDNVYIPSFIYSVTPYIELNLNSAFIN